MVKYISLDNVPFSLLSRPRRVAPLASPDDEPDITLVVQITVSFRKLIIILVEVFAQMFAWLMGLRLIIIKLLVSMFY